MSDGLSTQSNPISATPFEAFYDGSWHVVKHVSIKNGTIAVPVSRDGSTTEEKNIQANDLRLRPRKATSFDCQNFLKKGNDVSVFTVHPTFDSPENKLRLPMHTWNDATIISVKRVPHDNRCSCLFSVASRKGKYGRTSHDVKIDDISILQKLKFDPHGDGFSQWSSIDCTSSDKSKLVSDMFASVVSWMLVISILKGMNFEIKASQKKIINHIVNCHQVFTCTSDAQSYASSNTAVAFAVLTFRLCNDVLRPKIDYMRQTLSEEVFVNDQVLESCPVDHKSDSDSEIEILYEYTNLRQSKRRKTQPDRFVPTFNFRQQICQEPASNDDSSGFSDGIIDEHLYKAYQPDQGSNFLRRPDQRSRSHRKKQSRSFNEHLYKDCQSGQVEDSRPARPKNLKSGRKKLLSASESDVMLELCIKNLKSELEKLDEDAAQLPQNGLANHSEGIEDFCWNTSTDVQIENKEHEDLWMEMEDCLLSLSLRAQNQNSSIDLIDEQKNDEEEKCQHFYTLDEQIGMVCKKCKDVSTEIRYISPTITKVDSPPFFRERINRDDLDWMGHVPDSLINNHTTGDEPFLGIYENAWTLIPELNFKLHSHQKAAFEFIWRNLVGSLECDGRNQHVENTGGCVISHSPGSGKTLLVIAFLMSYLKVYPRSRPLILAPKIAICTWCGEFKKWEFPFPVYQIHPIESFRREMWYNEEGTLTGDNRKPSRKMMHAMDCVKKLQNWHEQPGVLLMSYSSYQSLTQEDDSKLEYQQVISESLRERPGLLILDEGHNPRSTKSKRRKLLMKLNTELRILLSGTVFQNNFEEYFNTLCLARPGFVYDILREFDPHTAHCLDGRKYRNSKRANRVERLARKLFVEKIGEKIKSRNEETQKQGIEILNRITRGFVDNYENDSMDSLPGLQVYTLMLEPTDIQQEILSKIQRPKEFRRCPLDLELLTTLASIHPWLIKSLPSGIVDKYFTSDDLIHVEKCKGNVQRGSKTKFVVDLVRKARFKGESVLVFCHNIPPINHIVELLESTFIGWHLGEQIFVLQGDQELSKRAEVMQRFNDKAKENCKVLLASTTACAEGISLTAASRVVLIDSEWNHSKTRQAIARAFRPGQERVVYVYELLSSGAWEEEKFGRNLWKAWMWKMTFTGKYSEHPSSREALDIEDEMLNELIEEDPRQFQMIKREE